MRLLRQAAIILGGTLVSTIAIAAPEQQAAAFMNIYSTHCLKYLHDFDGLRKQLSTTPQLPAEKAAEWGLIWECVADAEFAGRIDALAQQLAVAPTKALVRTRQAMHAAPGHTLEQQLSFEGGFMRELGWSRDYAEGVQAFMEKRPPQFTGE